MFKPPEEEVTEPNRSLHKMESWHGRTDNAVVLRIMAPILAPGHARLNYTTVVMPYFVCFSVNKQGDIVRGTSSWQYGGISTPQLSFGGAQLASVLREDRKYSGKG